MATNPTGNYEWGKPTVGGSTGVWGTELNSALDAIDTSLQTVDDLAAAAMPKLGGTFTGPVKSLESHETVINKGTVSGAVTLDLETGAWFYMSIDGHVTSVELTNDPADGDGIFVVVEITNTGVYNVAWGAEYEWPGGATPSQSSTGTDIYVLFTRDAGATVYAVRVAEDVS